MKDRSLLDTNILVCTDDPSAASAERFGISIRLVEQAVRSSKRVISTQVMQEY